jgi:glycosyltransferase involved in cell wall biosynthesis
MNILGVAKSMALEKMALEKPVQTIACDINTAKLKSRVVNHAEVRVLMIGEALNMQGGIVSVQKLILENIDSAFIVKHLPTLASSRSGEYIAKAVVFLKAIASLSVRLLQKKTDVIHAHVSERGSAYRISVVLFIAYLFHTPVVLHTHGSEFHSFYGGLPIVLQKWISWAFKSCARMIVLSESWKDFYVNDIGLLPEQVTVISNPVKIPTQIPSRSNSHKVKISFLGRIGNRKGAFDLIRAFSLLDDAQRECTELILAGDGEAEAARDLVKTLNLGSSITVLGWINSAQRDELLSSSNIFVLPSYNEGLPMAVLESMSWALPVITTPVGGIPEVITHGKNGLLVQPGDIKQLSLSLKSLIQDPSLRQSLGNTARMRIVPLGINLYCSSLSQVYTSVLDAST